MYLQKKLILSFITLFMILPCMAQNKYETIISSQEGEDWWGGMVALGSKMPYRNELRLIDLSQENLNNQNVPLFLSSKGRVVWSDRPFSFKTEAGNIHIYSQYEKISPFRQAVH